MKKPVAILSLLLASFVAMSQQKPLSDSYWKDHWKAVLDKEISPAQAAPAPSARENSSEDIQRLLKEMIPSLDIVRSGDSIRIARPDNMPVLMPDMRQVEKMPGSHKYTPAPPSKMPNPLYPRKKPGS